MSEAVLSFKAGLVNWDDQTKQATPKRGQGLVSIVKNPDDPSLHSFKWDPRGQYKQKCPESDLVDLLLFPGDATWEHVTECDTGRVFALTYKSSGQRLLFWMQQPTDAGKESELTNEDEQISETIGKLLDESSMMEEEEDDEMEDAPPADPQTPAANSQSTRSGSAPDNAGSLASSDVLAGDPTVRGGPAQRPLMPVTEITDAVPLDQFLSYISSASESELQQLYQHIPEGLDKNKEELIKIVRSSQFAQSLGSFGQVLNSEGIGGVISQQLGYQYFGEGIEGFLRGSRQAGQKDKENQDHEMQE